MSGHSKWSTIKRKKGVKDQKRGQIFSKFSRLITLAVREGGGIADPEKNVRLRLVVERARAENMPKSNIERAISRASGEGVDDVAEIIYEGFAPHNVSLVIHAATDNPNRTRSEVRQVLERGGGKMAGENAVLHFFKKCGVVVFDKASASEESIFAFVDKMSAIDIDEQKDFYVIYVPFENLGHVQENLCKLKASTIDLFYKPASNIMLEQESAERVEDLIEALESLDDVDKVYANFDVSE